MAGMAGDDAPAQTGDSRSLRSALEALQNGGLNLVFSDALVTPDLREPAEVDVTLPLHEQASALLAPFGLALDKAAPDVWYVVRAGGSTAGAADDSVVVPEPDPVPALEEIVVTSSRYRLVRDDQPLQRLDQRELAAMPSIGGDLLRIVNQLPGQASVGVSAESHIRGGDSDEVVYRLDGVQIIAPFHLGDFHGLFSSINPGLVDTINVYSSGFPVALGARLSGIIDMELVEPSRSIEGMADINLISASLHAQGFAGATRWLLAARRSTLHHLLDRLETDYGEPRFSDDLARFAWEGARGEVVLGIMNGEDDLELIDSSAGETATAEDRNTTVWLRGSRTLRDDLDASAFASVSRVRRNRRGTLDQIDDAVGALAERRDFTVRSVGGDLRWVIDPNWSLHGGIEGQQQKANLAIDLQTRYGALGEPLQMYPQILRSADVRRDGYLLSAFLSASNQVNEWIAMEYGVRYDLQDIDPVHDRQFSPRAQVTLQAAPSLRIFANAGRYTQHQNLYELPIDDGLLELSRSQLADQLSLGALWSRPESLHVRAEFYWRQIDHPWPHFENLYDRWVLLPELHADRVTVDPDRARTRGVELTVEHQVTDLLRWTVSFAAARAEERVGGGWQPRPWEQIRTWRAGLDWRPGHWVVGVNATHHSGWPTTSLQMAYSGGPGTYYDRNLPDYLSIDLHLARRIALRRSRLEFYLDVTNATLRGNVGGHRYRLVDGGYARDSRELLPAVPVLGVRWSW
jgi:outer membrane receptor protein involved in Fe transport